LDVAQLTSLEDDQAIKLVETRGCILESVLLRQERRSRIPVYDHVVRCDSTGQRKSGKHCVMHFAGRWQLQGYA
jgi:hypothetical protein